MNRMDGFTVNIEQGLRDVTANQIVSHNINPAFPEEITRLQVQDLSEEESFQTTGLSIIHVMTL